jgi:RND family efflux transporter MFP subunit
MTLFTADPRWSRNRAQARIAATMRLTMGAPTLNGSDRSPGVRAAALLLMDSAALLALFGLLTVPPALAQGRPPSPVRFTEAREHPVQRAIRLPGSVESRTAGLVASEVEGLVIELPAREGRTVRGGQPLARLRTTGRELRLSAATAQLKEAESRARLAERNLERARELFDSKVVSQQQLDDSFYEFNAWQGRVESLTAEIQTIKLAIDRSTIRAPFAGTIVSERTEIGEWIALGDPVMEIVALDELEVRVDVPERYFRNLKANGEAAVTFDSLPDVEVNGRITAIIPRADPQARTFPVKVRIANREGRIGVGMLAQVSLQAGESYQATVVPKDAVIRQGTEQVVFLINGDATVERASVATGAGVGAWVVVEGPVKAGQKVVTRGNERLQPGQTVRGEPLEYALP